MNRGPVARFGAYLFVVVVGTGGLWRVETTANKAQDAARDAQRALSEVEVDRLAAREGRCVKDDELNATLRLVGKQGPLEAVEAIIEIASRAGSNTPPDPAVIDQLRQIEGRRLDGLVNTLPAYRWDPKADTCVEVAMDAGG